MHRHPPHSLLHRAPAKVRSTGKLKLHFAAHNYFDNLKFSYNEVTVPHGFDAFGGDFGSSQPITVPANSSNDYLMKTTSGPSKLPSTKSTARPNSVSRVMQRSRFMNGIPCSSAIFQRAGITSMRWNASRTTPTKSSTTAVTPTVRITSTILSATRAVLWLWRAVPQWLLWRLDGCNEPRCGRFRFGQAGLCL